MSILARKALSNAQVPLAFRAFSCTPALETKQWRASKGLPLNHNAEGMLTDGPDYTFLDGRPTPLLHKQKLRVIKQQETATKIVTLCSELEFAKQRYKKMEQKAVEERQKYIDNRLKPKGDSLRKKEI